MGKRSSCSGSTVDRHTAEDGRGIGKRSPSQLELESQRDVRLAHELYERAHDAGYDVSLRWAMAQIIRSPAEADDADPLVLCARDRGRRAKKPMTQSERELLESRLKTLRAFRRSLGIEPQSAGRRADTARVSISAHAPGHADHLHAAIEGARDELWNAVAAASDELVDLELNADLDATASKIAAERAERDARARRGRRRRKQH